MTTTHSKLTAQGQISVPARIRRKLGVGPGSMLAWDEEDGHVIVRRASRYSSADIHQALFPAPPKARTLTELKEGIGLAMRRRHEPQVRAAD